MKDTHTYPHPYDSNSFARSSRWRLRVLTMAEESIFKLEALDRLAFYSNLACFSSMCWYNRILEAG